MNVFDYLFEFSKIQKKNFVLGNSEEITFKETYQKSLKVAEYIINNSELGDNILLVKTNSIFFITAYLGIIKAGRVCVPLDFSIEQKNFDYISELTESNIVFCGVQIKKD